MLAFTWEDGGSQYADPFMTVAQDRLPPELVPAELPIC